MNVLSSVRESFSLSILHPRIKPEVERVRLYDNALVPMKF